MRRDPRVDKLQRLRTERMTRASGGYYGTRATVYGNVQHGPRRRNGGRTLLSLVVLLAAIGIVLYGVSQYALNGYRPAATQQARPRIVYVAPGENVSDLGADLQRKGLIFNAGLFHWYLRFTGYSVKAGAHTLTTGMTMDQVAQALAQAPAAAPTALVTIYPGWRAEQVAAALNMAGVATYDAVLNEIKYGVFTYPFLADRVPGAGVEGYLLPDTYLFRKGGGAHYAVTIMLNNFAHKVPPALRTQGKRLYGSFYKTIILASIVEREAGAVTDFGKIASVFANRLHDASGKFVSLGADSTIQYIVNHGPTWWAPIATADLHNPSPYNTRMHAGLPPTPISEPSLAAIVATANPPATPYFYFHHVPGSHHLSIFCTIQQGSECPGAPQ